ncbi:MAG: exo-alpha-sialidase [Clostridia bacterium]|nr:exo-alpha-sialidase [Clostridia bacterium]
MNNKMPKYIVVNPGDEVTEKHRAWQGCPTIARTKGGRLFAGWYTGGMIEPCINNYNVLVQSDDNGSTWSAPILAVYSDYDAMHRNIDIQLWVDEKGRLWVMWTQSPFYKTSEPASLKHSYFGDYHKEFTGVEALICNNPDADELIWEQPRVICDGFLRSKPIIRHNGDYVVPAYDWINAENYMLRISKDGGATFEDIVAAKKPQNKVFDETMAYEIGTKLCILARTNLGYYAESHSLDDGKTWSDTAEYQKAPSTRLYIGRLSGGQLALVRSISDTERQGMKVCISEDDGATWPYELILDTRTDLSYPDLEEGENGEIFIVYDRERHNLINLNRETWTSSAAKEILLAKITVDDIYNGSLSENSYTARVISKAEINLVER